MADDPAGSQGAAFPDCAWYDRFYAAVHESKAYARYCELVFGKDFSQQGFGDVRQIDFMLDRLRMRSGDRVLDVGCGNGKMIEYVSDRAGAVGYGFDFSPVAIEHARKRTVGKAERLVFEVGDIGRKQYDAASLDVVLSVDTLYFTDDIGRIVADIRRWLRPHGKMAMFFSEFRFSDDDPLSNLRSDGSRLALALRDAGIGHDAYDFTESHYEHMKLKRQVISGMRHEFEAERTTLLWDNAFAESTEGTVTYDDFRAFSSRYLYVAQKP